MVLSRQRTQLKNRVHATLGKYGYVVEGVSDAFGKSGREIVAELLAKLPPHTQQALQRVLDQLDHVTGESQSDRSRNDRGFCSLSRDHLA